MEMSAKLLPVGFTSPTILRCLILAFKADVTYHSFITSTGIRWKAWFEKSLSDVSQSPLQWQNVCSWEAFGLWKVRCLLGTEKESTQVWKMLDYSAHFLKKYQIWSLKCGLYCQKADFNDRAWHSCTRNSVYFNGEVENFPLKLSSKAYWH